MNENDKQAEPVQPVEPVGHQYQSRDGTWNNFLDQKHYENTVADGAWPIRAIYTESPAAAINEQLYTALEGLLAIARDSQGVAGYHLNGVVAKWDEFEEISAAEDAIAEAEKAKGGAV